MLSIIYYPKVTLIGASEFKEPEHMPVNFLGGASDPEKLVEFGGRLCYMSQKNPANRETAQYIENILKQKHGSVLEHAVFTLLLEGISRSCTHELVRHRAGFGYSQLSQRYVDESQCSFVVPPAIISNEKLVNAWIRAVKDSQNHYIELVNKLMEQYSDMEDKVLRRKIAREAARSVLPNSVETKIVVTGNARAWRTMLELRCGEHADKEIRRLSLQILVVLQKHSPALFGDFEIMGDSAIPKYSKV